MSRFIVVLALLVSGCANFATVNRATELPGGGKAIHLDAAQRLVYASSNGDICAEPTPDALQSYAAAMGAGAGVNDRGSAVVSNAFSANAGSIGLRTQSITLMRDTLYRICEYSHNKGSNPLDVVQLLQRSQDLTLGTLAIEQLTGVVAARQVALNAGASSSAGSSINDTDAQLTVANNNLAAKKTALELAQSSESVQKDVVQVATAALASENARNPQVAAQVKAATDELSADQARLDALHTASTDAAAAVTRAQASVDAIEKMFNSALASGSAGTSGGAQLAGGAALQNITSDTAGVLADATIAIVDTILTKGHMTDTCMNFLTRPAEESVRSAPGYAALVAKCTEVMTVQMQQFVDASKLAQAKVPATGHTRPVTLSVPFEWVNGVPQPADSVALDDAALGKLAEKLKQRADAEKKKAAQPKK